MYVQTILDVHKKYNALVMTAFNNDAGFVAALDKVRHFAHFLFKNRKAKTTDLYNCQVCHSLEKKALKPLNLMMI